MILDILQRLPVTLVVLGLFGLVVVESLALLAVATPALLRRDAQMIRQHADWFNARLRLVSDVGRLAVSIGFFGTVLGLIGAAGAFRDGSPDALLTNLDLVLETTALGLATFLTAQFALLTLAPRRSSQFIDRMRRQSP